MVGTEEIARTRAEGFGGSDARMVIEIAARIREDRPLTATQRKRLRVIKGLENYVEVPETDNMRAGHDFEDSVAQDPQFKGWAREPMLKLDSSRPFKIFSHADFFTEEGGVRTVAECKWSRTLDVAGLLDRYRWQLQQYFLLGVDRVFLIACCLGEDGNGQVRRYVEVERDDADVAALMGSYDTIAYAWDVLDVEGPAGECSDELMRAIERVSELKMEADRATERLEIAKAAALELMRSEGVSEFSNDFVSASIVPASVVKSFDSAKFKKANPELAAKYVKEISRKEYINIKIK